MLGIRRLFGGGSVAAASLLIVGAAPLAAAMAAGAKAVGRSVRRESGLSEVPAGVADIVIATGDEAADLASASALVDVRSTPAHADTPWLTVNVACEDLATIAALQTLDARAGSSHMRIRPLSAGARRARRLLLGHSVDRLRFLDRPVCPLIVGTGAAGTGRTGEHLLLQMLRMLHFPGTAIDIRIAGADAAAWLAQVKARVPGLDAIAAVGAVADMRGAFADAARPPCAVYVIDADAFEPAALPATLPPPVYWLVDAKEAPDGAIVAPAPSWADEIATLVEDPADRLAEAVHRLYLEECRLAGQSIGERPSLRPWTELPEQYRAANRHQADHIATKLRALGARTLPDDGGPRFSFTDRECEMMAKLEHRRWEAVQRIAGWTYGPVRDDTAMHTPFLVPFSELTEQIRDLDRLSVRAISGQVALSGLTIARDFVIDLLGGAAPPGASFRRGFSGVLESLVQRFPDRPLVLRTTAATAIEADGALAGMERAGAAVTIVVDPDTGGAAPASLLARAERIVVGPRAPLPDAALSIRLGEDAPRANGRCVTLDAGGRVLDAPWP